MTWRGRVLAETEECHLLGCEVLWAIGRERAYCWDAGGPFGDWPLRSACRITKSRARCANAPSPKVLREEAAKRC